MPFTSITSLCKAVQGVKPLIMNDLENRVSDPKLRYCLQRIEQKLGWGSSSDWKTRDFERLSDDILAETETLLSSTTLKRVWGEIK